MRIEQAAPEHAGLYRLELEHKNWGKWEGPRVVAVNVISPPTNLCVRAQSEECLSESDWLEVDQFERLTLSVEAEGSEPFSFQWFIDNKPIPEVDGGRSSSLRVSTERGGVFQYTAAVGNRTVRVHTEPVEITVSAAPRLLRVLLSDEQVAMPDDPIEVRQFDPLTLTVQAESMLPMSYRWYRGDDPVPEEDGGAQAALTVHTTRPGTFRYHAKIENDIGYVLTNPYDITVSVCPRRIFQPLHQRLSSPTSDCSLSVALLKMLQNASLEDWQWQAIAFSHALLGSIEEALESARTN